jgi:hypothetical protein
MLNIPTLSTLVLWAAEEELRDTNPDRAMELGIPKKGDPRLGRHAQDAWGTATRNGVCQTAFCIAGGAVQLSNEWVIVMQPRSQGDWYTDYVIRRSDIPARLQGEVQWDMLWLEETYDSLDLMPIVRTIDAKAEELLGLTEVQADHLFEGENDATMVVSLAMQFAAEEGNSLILPQWVAEEFYDPSALSDYLSETDGEAIPA